MSDLDAFATASPNLTSPGNGSKRTMVRLAFPGVGLGWRGRTGQEELSTLVVDELTRAVFGAVLGSWV
eukprot:8961951-Pyramimonas_sp.AAC.1